MHWIKKESTVRYQQLTKSLKKYALSTFTLFKKNPRKALQVVLKDCQAVIKTTPIFKKEVRPALLFFLSTVVVTMLLLLEALNTAPRYTPSSDAGFFDQTEELTSTTNYSQEAAQMSIPGNTKELAREALLWLSVLKSYNDFELSNEQLMTKFKNMSIAYTILSTTSDGPIRRKYWSEQAVQYGRYSLGVLEGMIPVKDHLEIDEINTRLLIAMALNYYEDGSVNRLELVKQYQKISTSFLVRTGFCNNRILKTLHDDSIIDLPNQLSLKSI